jgi:hypothetical protein
MTWRRALAIMVIGAVTMCGEARSAVLPVEKATELLARSKAANDKCKILSGVDSQELDMLTERARLVLVRKTTTKRAEQVLRNGLEVGTNVMCDETTKRAVTGVLLAAREAVASIAPVLRGTVAEEITPTLEVNQSNVAVVQNESLEKTRRVAVEPIVQKPRSAEPPATTQKSRQQKIAKKTTAQKSVGKIPVDSARLSSYQKLAESYYRERRCRNMASSSLRTLYQKVVAMHRASVQSFGAPAVSQVLRRAEQRAGQRTC